MLAKALALHMGYLHLLKSDHHTPEGAHFSIVIICRKQKLHCLSENMSLLLFSHNLSSKCCNSR